MSLCLNKNGIVLKRKTEMSSKVVSHLNFTASFTEEMHKLLDSVHYPRAKAYKSCLPETWRREHARFNQRIFLTKSLNLSGKLLTIAISDMGKTLKVSPKNNKGWKRSMKTKSK